MINVINEFRFLLLALSLFFCWTTAALCAPVVLFDEGHGQQFLAGQDGELDLSAFAEVMKQQGFSLQTTPEALTPELLQKINVLVISGPFMPVSEEEIDAVAEFIANGGGLAVMLHIGPPLKGLLHRLDVDFSNGTLRETTGMIGDNPLDFQVTDLTPHPLTENLDSFSVYGAWALRGTADFAKEIARTGPHGWVDLDRDQKLSTNDAAQSFAVLVAGNYGKGKFAVFGDDALFQNRFLDENNRRLAENLARWMVPEQ
ncbi:MAG: DUF4350 domain-containing protein [Deltaproteobacteria bacterium]|jgi:hypothetical protein|nr:DUF4350 domain-containing protein [Deltaproteobacteria bacterium]